MKKTIVTLMAAALLATSFDANAQSSFTREQILNMTVDELSDLPLEELMAAVEALGVSSVDELFAMIMNKNVSSASKKEEDSFKSPLSSTVITKAELRTYGISTIEEAFRLIPGMIVTEKTNGVYDIQMRGLNNIPDNNMFLYTENANSLIMIDGRPVQSYVMGSVNMDALPISIEDVERIEVVRGACGALYGANAVTGVINIITDKPSSSSPIVSGSYQMGSQNTYIGDIAIRKAFSSKVAAGITFNIQYRERPTDKLYVIPGQSGLFYCKDQTVMPVAGSEQTTPYYYQMGTPEFLQAYAQYQKIFGALTDVDANKASLGGYYTTTEIDNFKQLYPVEYDAAGNPTKYRLFDAKEPETLGADMFKHPEIARKNIGINGYLTFTPADDIKIDLTGGYQNSYATTTPVGDDIFSFNVRVCKTGYVAADANIKDLHVQANYNGGVGDYANGVPGFKIRQNEVNFGAEYDINVGENLSIRPGFYGQYLKYDDYVPEFTDKDSYKWEFEKPGYKYTEGQDLHLSGFLYYGGKLSTLAPSIRLDYQKDAFRIIGAYRADKTNVPDKWQHSWQLAASYSINDNNFIRLVYGRSNRGTNLVNSYADFDWERTNMVYPRTLHFQANEEAPLVKIDNIELGYRWKPAQNVLIDAEAFYSISNQYGALMAEEGSMLITQEEMGRIVQMTSMAATGIIAQAEAAGADYHILKSESVRQGLMLRLLSGNDLDGNKVDMGQILNPFATIAYKELPYKVHQMGISLNMDYIISSKLIAKLNANIQRTTIDNYYKYSQTEDIQLLLSQAKDAACYAQLKAGATDPTNPSNYDISGDVFNSLNEFLDKYIEARDANNGEQPAGAWMNAGNEVFQNGYDARRTGVNFGKVPANSIPRTYTNGKKHEATPSFYGMIGLIYKPLQKLECSAFANFIGKRTYLMKYGAAELDPRVTLNLKVGYHPIQDFEIFFNAHNLFNSTKREFAYCDENGGIYTFGVNFGF